MNGANGDALEWAMALLRAPGQRHALRHAQLPQRVDRLLGVAAGVLPKELAEAARAFNESEARIREAARFYAREVLFFPQADAYRVLGVEAGAEDAQVKAHHRLLQHWLHPDRLDSEDDAVFAARVNVAWNRLRTPERRRVYDEALRQDRAAGVFEHATRPQGMRAWATDAEVRTATDWRHRLPMLVLSVCCLLLAVLVVRDLERKPATLERAGNRLHERMAETEAPMISLPGRAVPDAIAAAPDDREHARRAAAAQTGTTVAVVPVAASTSERATLPSATRSEDAMPPLQPPVARAESMPLVPAAASALPVRSPPAPVANMPVQNMPVANLPGPESAVEDAVAKHIAQPAASTRGLPGYDRIRKAWAAGEQLLGYMQGSAHSPPPIWNSPGIQSSADRVRLELQQVEGMRLAAPQWTVGSDIAVLRVDFAGSTSAHAGGLLTADLSWREGRWLVTGLSIEHSQ